MLRLRGPTGGEAVAELEQALCDIKPEAGQHRIRALVGASYSGVRETVRCWAEQRQWPIIEPPAPARILAGDESCFEAVAARNRSNPGALGLPWRWSTRMVRAATA
jgi:hypothetical protein